MLIYLLAQEPTIFHQTTKSMPHAQATSIKCLFFDSFRFRLRIIIISFGCLSTEMCASIQVRYANVAR